MVSGDVVKTFRVKLPSRQEEKFENLIQAGIYITYADALRHAIALLIEEHKDIIEGNDF
jgi:Arc/MetJ-type ribon-helix-helix transcriptional regulator